MPDSGALFYGNYLVTSRLRITYRTVSHRCESRNWDILAPLSESLFQCLYKDLLWLGTRDGIFAIEHEEGHSAYAQFRSFCNFGFHFLLKLILFEHFLNLVFFQAYRLAKGGKYSVIRNIFAVYKMSFEQFFFNFISKALSLSKMS